MHSLTIVVKLSMYNYIISMSKVNPVIVANITDNEILAMRILNDLKNINIADCINVKPSISSTYIEICSKRTINSDEILSKYSCSNYRYISGPEGTFSNLRGKSALHWT